MNLNWKMLKIVFAVIVVIGTLFWALDSVRARSYSGANLNFEVGSGPIAVTNQSNGFVPVQLIGAGTASFRVSSTIDQVAGNPTRQGSGRTATYLFEFELPPGMNEITIARGTDVKFVTNTETQLQVTVQPLSEDRTRATLIVTIIIVLSALYYISRATNHRWINALRRQETPVQDLKPVTETAAARQGSVLKPYGDNRSEV